MNIRFPLSTIGVTLCLLSYSHLALANCDGNCNNGKGKYTYSNGNNYEGDWQNGTQTGKGTFIWQHGDKDMYQGDWLNNNQHGKGKYTWENGNTYEGDYVNDKATGKGTFTWVCGFVYTGDFVNGDMNGFGTLLEDTGSFYEGEFLNDEKNGFGKMVLVKGDNEIEEYQIKNQGNWQGDVYVVKGMFNDGDLIKECASRDQCEGKK